MHTYQFSLYVWPYSGVERKPAKYTVDSDPSRGAPDPTIDIEASNFDEAVGKCKDILRGVRLDERVWECGIVDVRRIK